MMKRREALPLLLGRQLHCGRLSLDMRRRILTRQAGQGLVEFALVVPIFLLLIFAVFGVGALLENKIALNDAARNGARFAAAQPDLWSATYPTAAPNTIESAIQHSGSTIKILNDDTSSSLPHIRISYYTVSNGVLTLCGYYHTDPADPTTPDFVHRDGTSESVTPFTDQNHCLTPGNVIKVTITGSFPLPVPLVSRFLPRVVTITTNATAMEEQGP